MTRTAALVSGLLVFLLVVGTANSGGYRFGISDQAFYVPALALRLDNTLFPRDRDVFEPQMRLWLGDEVIGAFAAVTGLPTPVLFGLLYVLAMIGLGLAAVALARSLGFDWWSIAAFLILLSLRHRIARTGANSLEGYMHPRMLAFACGLTALAYVTRLRPWTAAAWVALATIIHTSTAIWFAGVVAIAVLWPLRNDVSVRRLAVAAAVVAAVALSLLLPRLPVMDPAWLAVLADRDYLFSADWPLYAWLTNLAYPVVILAIYKRRERRATAVPGESGLVAGLLALVVVFAITVPLAEMHVAFFVQLQANRVFWILDAVVAAYLAWWMADVLLQRMQGRGRLVLVALLATLAIGRGTFVLCESGRPLARFTLANDDWTDVMRWLRDQPASWHVLADPGHAYKYGSSVRVAALRDTPLELGKDPAMAMYDRALAARVAERTAALGGFDEWTTVEELRSATARYDVDVFVDRTDRTFPLPTLFRNHSFVVYDLR